MNVMLEKHPERVIRQAVKGMLPKTILGRHMLQRLKVYGGPDHPHEAQVRGTLKQQQRKHPDPNTLVVEVSEG